MVRSMIAALLFVFTSSLALAQPAPGGQAQPGTPGRRVALVIGNCHYPDAAAPLDQSINDARALTETLRRDGFEVDVVEDASKDDMARARVLRWREQDRYEGCLCAR